VKVLQGKHAGNLRLRLDDYRLFFPAWQCPLHHRYQAPL
jgi:hypothetical protein